MPKILIFDAFTLLICEKNIVNYALLRCKTFSLKMWLCKILDKYHVWFVYFVQIIIEGRVAGMILYIDYCRLTALVMDALGGRNVK